ncbi:MAG: aminotransferase class I/II-fold pyridoxal phosphate-dependent enzyme [Dehalococcoidia bacterium]|nr:aminotransferase class I/II-fold pyridoxal phosphate-dependent enzyme [Dehalococcoidia bacterium]
MPRREDYSIDVKAIKSAIDDRTKVVFVTSPNNPTGNLTPQTDIEALLKAGILVVVDEAYHEFAKESVVSLVRGNPNLVVLRTFSKWAGLAGLRVGYGVMSPELVDMIYRMKMPYNITIAAQIAVRETFRDMDYMQGRINAIIAERDRMFAKLKAQGILDPIESRSNFILCRVLKGQAREIKAGLERKGIFIRYFDKPMLQNMIRISVGRPEDTDAVIAALAEVA